MVTYVQNKLIKVTIIVDISIIGFNAHCMLCIRYQLATFFHNPDSKCFKKKFMDGLCVVYVWLGQTSVNNLCLTLDWHWSDVLLASTFTRGKTLTFLSMQKMCAEVDAHNKFIRRSRQSINEFWRTSSESQRTDQNSSFFVRWTCVMVCVTGPLHDYIPLQPIGSCWNPSSHHHFQAHCLGRTVLPSCEVSRYCRLVLHSKVAFCPVESWKFNSNVCHLLSQKAYN